jgi:hypothetical protein
MRWTSAVTFPDKTVSWLENDDGQGLMFDASGDGDGF